MTNIAHAFSFEFFPPKTIESMTQLQETSLKLATTSPQFFSVTYGAGGSTRDGTLNTVKMLKEKTSTSVAPHVSCIGSTRREITELLYAYKALGINRIVALRGDLPSGMGYSNELNFASELIDLIRQTTGDFFHIDIAAYPEVHPQAVNAKMDLLNFKNKVTAGANSAITQYFFNADAYFYFLDECMKNNISIPIVPGIMPITQFIKLAQFSDRCGTEIPRWVRKRLEVYGEDTHSIKSFGIEFIYELCQKLIKGGAPSLHFYTINHAEPSFHLANMLQTSLSYGTSRDIETTFKASTKEHSNP